MKNLLKIFLLLAALQLTGCKDDNEISERDVKTDMLTGSWGNAYVMHNPDGDLSDQYTKFMIVFTGNGADGYDGSFIISNGGYAFHENVGSWKFNDALTQIILDSGKVMEFELNETNLHLEFTTTESGGRVEGLSGDFEFDLQPL